MGGDALWRLLQLPEQEVRPPGLVPGPQKERQAQAWAQDRVRPARCPVPPETPLPYRLGYCRGKTHAFISSVPYAKAFYVEL